MIERKEREKRYGESSRTLRLFGLIGLSLIGIPKDRGMERENRLGTVAGGTGDGEDRGMERENRLGTMASGTGDGEDRGMGLNFEIFQCHFGFINYIEIFLEVMDLEIRADNI